MGSKKQWRAKALCCGYWEVVDEEGESISTNHYVGDDLDGDNYSVFDVKEDACIVAAAPDLLEALESSNMLLRVKRHHCESSEVCRVLDTHISRNRAAIAKAKGEPAC